MKKNLRYWVGAAVGAVVALGFSSCAYDPYYSTSVGGSYSAGGGGVSYSSGGGGYGDGYGYGGSSFSTSLFVGTGNSQWGYDPVCHSYYDYQRRCYYDPYLNGYYPMGYRPQVVYGTPHPYGWHRGSGYISPPRRVSYGNVVDYRNRESRYRDSGYDWARQDSRGRGEDDRRSESRGGERNSSSNFDSRQRSDSRTSFQTSRPQYQQSEARQDRSARQSFERSQPARQDFGTEMKQRAERQQTRYNDPVSAREESSMRQQGQRAERQSSENRREQPQERVKSNKSRNSREEEGRVQGYR